MGSCIRPAASITSSSWLGAVSFAAHLGGRELWLVPPSFESMMIMGDAFGMAGIELPLVEIGISLSVVILGIAVAVGYRIPTAAAMAMVGFLPSAMVTRTAQRRRRRRRDGPAEAPAFEDADFIVVVGCPGTRLVPYSLRGPAASFRARIEWSLLSAACEATSGHK
jgi:hypothetical protein